jgi:hypothetical protein
MTYGSFRFSPRNLPIDVGNLLGSTMQIQWSMKQAALWVKLTNYQCKDVLFTGNFGMYSTAISESGMKNVE